MEKEVYEKQKAFAGEKKPSMLRRCVGHDYRSRQMYLITMVTEGRRQLLGKLVGKSNGKPGTADEPCLIPSPLGKCVEKYWYEISIRYPQIDVLAIQLMPDHFHGILFVKDQLPLPMGKVLLGFKHGCNKAFRQLFPSFAALQQQTTQKEDRSHGMLFVRGYNDKLLLRAGQLNNWRKYLRDNPRRLLMKHEHPDLFKVQREVMINGFSFSAIGNIFLLQRPSLLQVQCSRSLTPSEIQDKVTFFSKAAEEGAVLVSPSISPGEKAVMRAAFDYGFPIVILQENGFADLAKPCGKRMEACAEGRLLVLAPWEHHNERITVSRSQFLSLNEMARTICEASDRQIDGQQQ